MSMKRIVKLKAIVNGLGRPGDIVTTDRWAAQALLSSGRAERVVEAAPKPTAKKPKAPDAPKDEQNGPKPVADATAATDAAPASADAPAGTQEADLTPGRRGGSKKVVTPAAGK